MPIRFACGAGRRGGGSRSGWRAVGQWVPECFGAEAKQFDAGDWVRLGWYFALFFRGVKSGMSVFVLGCRCRPGCLRTPCFFRSAGQDGWLTRSAVFGFALHGCQCVFDDACAHAAPAGVDDRCFVSGSIADEDRQAIRGEYAEDHAGSAGDQAVRFWRFSCLKYNGRFASVDLLQPLVIGVGSESLGCEFAIAPDAAFLVADMQGHVESSEFSLAAASAAGC